MELLAKIVNRFQSLTFAKASVFRVYQNCPFMVSFLCPANIYLFKVSNRNTRKRCEICPKSRKSHINLYFDQRAFSEKYISQSFGRDTQPEKCLKIAIFTAISDVLFLIIRLFPLYFNV